MTPDRKRSAVLQLSITIVAVLLAVLTWTFTLASIGTEERAAREHAEGSVVNLAMAVEWQLSRQLQAIDDAMQAMVIDWRDHPERFDPAAWRRRSSLLRELSPEVSLLDADGVVRASTQPALVGARLANLPAFQVQTGVRRGLFIAPAVPGRTGGGWEIDLSRRLEHEDGSFAGVLLVGYDPWALTSVLRQVDLGARGLIALVADDGTLRLLAAPAGAVTGLNIADSPLFRDAVQAGRRVWTGPSAPDGVVRMLALQRRGDLGLTVVVGVEEAEGMRPATDWAAHARTFAGSISCALLIMAWLLVREVRLARAREERLAENQHILEDAYTELAAAKTSAERKTAQLEATLAGMSDGMMLLDPELRLVQWNERFPAYTGTPAEILRVGVPMEEMLRAQAKQGEFGPVDVEEEVARRMARLRAHRGVGVTERTRPNGRTLELRRAALPEGSVVTLYIDVTARKQTEEAHAQARRLAEEAIEQKSRFVAIVSHEIRTPLNAVVNSLALLDQSELTSAQHALADTAREAGEALLDLVRDILDLTGAEAGRLTLRPIAFEPRPMLEGVRDMFAAQAAGRGVELRLEVTPEVPQALRADRGRLRQVVMNLASNAAKFADRGTVTIHAAVIDPVGSDEAGRPTLRIGVRDQGPRIPEREAARLFQPFSRLENAHAGGTAGSGLGLAICERLMRLMGGQVGLGPSPEGGNEFWLALPLEVATALPAPAPAPAQRLPSRRRPARVLVVEDLPPNQLIAATILRREGHRVDIADSGPEALRLMRSRPYDVVLMDLVMPGMGGDEAARQIRAMPPPASAVPIVALTATTAPEDRARCLAAGMLEVLGKPVQPAELLGVVARLGSGRAVAPPPPVAAPVLAEGPVLDAARLADLRRSLPMATLAPLVEECLADLRQRVPRLHEALGVGQARPVEEVSHAMAGLAGNFGLSVLEARMRRIMTAARAGDLGTARAAAEGVEVELRRCSEAIRVELAAAA